MGLRDKAIILLLARLACIIHERMAKAFCGGTRLPKMLMAP
jgi:hypothetical protein